MKRVILRASLEAVSKPQVAPGFSRAFRVLKPAVVNGVLTVMVMGVMTAPTLSHYSFAMYDQTVTRTLTGKLIRYIPGANHAQLIFELLEPDGQPTLGQNGKPVRWGVETGSAASLARQGVAPRSFPEGTIFTVTLHPLRDGRTFGAIAGLLIKCGPAMPKGGCTKETGQVLISGTSGTP